MLMFCSLYVFNPFPDSRTFPFQPFFLLECKYVFALCDLITYFRCIVGKSTPFSIINLWCDKILPFLEGMLSFLLSLYTQYSLSKYIERYRAIQILMSLFLCKVSSFVCVFICSISSCLSYLFPLVVDTSSIPIGLYIC